MMKILLYGLLFGWTSQLALGQLEVYDYFPAQRWPSTYFAVVHMKGSVDGLVVVKLHYGEDKSLGQVAERRCTGTG